MFSLKALWRLIVGMVVVTLLVSNMAMGQATSNQDKELTMQVEKFIAKFYSPQQAKVTCQALAARITLTGTVPSFYDRQRVVQIAAMVDGVEAISDQLTVVTSSVADRDIQAAITRNLRDNASLSQPEKIIVSVKNGNVTLTGTADHLWQALAIAEIAGWQRGVRSVDNQLAIKLLGGSDQELERVAHDFLTARFPLEARAIRCTIANGMATLTGIVARLWVKEDVERQLRYLLGVKRVNNQIVVNPEALAQK